MDTVGLSHFNITASDELLEKVRDFYVEVLGLAVGERPSFMPVEARVGILRRR